MSNRHRQSLMPRPDNRASPGSRLVSGRFTNALSQAIRHEDFAQPPLPPHTFATAHQQQQRKRSPDEELEEIEQMITLTLQEIDANFDKCQRTMARDVMPKVEQMGKLSSELLEASHPWLQFFMSVASADDQSDDSFVRSVQDESFARTAGADDTTQFGTMGLAQRAALEEQAGRGEITARFPDQSMQLVIDDDDEVGDGDRDTDVITPSTPRAGAAKRIAANLSPSERKKHKGNETPQRNGGGGTPSSSGRTPVSMMRAWVHAKHGRNSRPVKYGATPGSVGSMGSHNSSSMGTADLMPDTSPPHTMTFALPRSRRIAPPLQPGDDAAAGKEVYMEDIDDEVDDDDDEDMLEEINTLLHRYETPSQANGKANAEPEGSSVLEHVPSSAKSLPLSSAKSLPVSLAKSLPVSPAISVPASTPKSTPASAIKTPQEPETVNDDDDVDDGDEDEDLADMQVLVAKYAGSQSASVSTGVNGTDADVEQLRDDAEAMEIDGGNADQSTLSSPLLRTSLSPLSTGGRSSTGNVSAVTATNPTRAQSRPQSQATATRPRPQSQNAMTRPQRQNAMSRPQSQNATSRPAAQSGHTRQFGRRSLISMDVQQMDVDDISPLANRGSRHQQPPTRIPQSRMVQPSASYTERFQPLGVADGEDDPFGPSPERSSGLPAPRRPQPVRSVPRQPDRPGSAQSEGAAGLQTERRRPQSATTASASFTSRSDTLMGSDNTVTIHSPGLDMGNAGHRGLQANTTDSQLDESSISLENQDFTGNGLGNMDGTTTILPTREMLQQAARQAENSSDTA